MGKSEAHWQPRPQHFGDARSVERPPRTTAAVAWSRPELRQAMCAAEGGAREVTQELWRSLRGEWIPDAGYGVIQR